MEKKVAAKPADMTKAPPKKMATTDETPIVKSIDPMKQTRLSFNLPLIIIAIAIVIAGGFTGYVLAQTDKTGGKRGAPIGGTEISIDGLKKAVGVADESTFKDSAEGTLREGGIEDGVGTHHLERPGGPSQNVYLTSSTIPLNDYIGKKVKVWGETFEAQQAGWFMDVGRLELLE